VPTTIADPQAMNCAVAVVIWNQLPSFLLVTPKLAPRNRVQSIVLLFHHAGSFA